MENKGKILLKFGAMTDNHLSVSDPQNALRTERIFDFFKQHEVNAVVNCGDISDRYSLECTENFCRMFDRAFPEGSAEKFWIAAGHDVLGAEDKIKAYSEVAECYDCGGLNPVKIIHGFLFIGISQEQDWEILESTLQKYYKNDGKPVFVVTHEPPHDTVLKSKYKYFLELRQILNKYPQVINISGHTHSPVFLDRMIWQGEFTVVNAGSLYYWKDDPMGAASRKLPSCDALIFEVYEDRIILRRFDMLDMQEFPPFSLTLPFDPGSAPFNPDLRSKTFCVPEIPNPEAEIIFDAVPFKTATLKLPHPAPVEAFHRLRIQLYEEQDQVMPSIAVFDDCSTYGKQEKELLIKIPDGLLSGSRKYHAVMTPMNIYNVAGRMMEFDFCTPESALEQLPFEGIAGIRKENGVLEQTMEFSTEHEMEIIHILLPQALKDHKNKNLCAVVEVECEHEGNPAILMAYGTAPDFGRHYFPRGKVPRQRHSFRLDHLKGDAFSLLLGEGSPGKYKIHDVKYYAF